MLNLIFTFNSSITISIFLGVLLVLYLWKRNSELTLPGPWRLPIIGNLHQMGSNLHIILHEMRKKYGDIFQVKLGQQNLVIVSGRKLVNEVLVNQSTKYSMRPDSIFGKYLSKGKSFSFSPMSHSDYKHFKTHALSALKKTEKSFSTSLPSADSSSELIHLTLEELFSHEAVSMGKDFVLLSENYEKTYKNSKKGTSDYKDAAMNLSLTSSTRLMTHIIMGKRYLYSKNLLFIYFVN